MKKKTNEPDKFLEHFSLEKGIDGIFFLNFLPLFFPIINVAKQLQVEVFLTAKSANWRDYVV